MYTLNETFQTEFRQMKDKFFFQRLSMNHGLKNEGPKAHMFSCHYSHVYADQVPQPNILIDIWANDVDAPEVTRTGIVKQASPCFLKDFSRLVKS